MPIYHQMGTLTGTEELVGNREASSLLHHLYAPTRVLSTRQAFELVWKRQTPRPLAYRHFRTHRMAAADRVPLLFNDDVALLTWTPHKSGFYRNAQADEVLYVSEGAGVLETQMGELAYKSGDYVVIPRGVIHKLRMDPVRHRFLVIESRSAVRIPGKYRAANGQLTGSAPFRERDIRRPSALPVHDEMGQFSIVVKKDNWLQEVVLDHHPFDVTGWDGYYYPWATSAVVELEADGFVLGSFLPQSDVVAYYVKSLRGMEVGSLTLHPDGLSHGAHSTELAVMLGALRPLEIGEGSLSVEDMEYARS